MMEQVLTDTKQCVYCAETIKAEAKICRFCNRSQSVEEISQPHNQDDISAEQNNQLSQPEEKTKKSLLKAISVGDYIGAEVSILDPQLQGAYQAEVDRRKRSTGVAYLLWFFLGMLGVHKFYIGENGWGAVYLLCTILSLITFVSIVVTLIGAFFDPFSFQDRYGILMTAFDRKFCVK